jgi:tetrahydromethanopterin S-methyltransferase subunit B
VTTIETRHGDVDASVLEELRHSFDARAILMAVERIDHIRDRIDAVREDLMRLHAVANDLIHEADPADLLPGDGSVWELAETLSTTMADWPDSIEEIFNTLAELEALAPGPGAEDDEPPYDED